MALFEGFRRRPAAETRPEPTPSSGTHAESGLTAAERQAEYAKARLGELLPDFREEARFEIAAKTAESALRRAHETRRLTQQILTLRQKTRPGSAEYRAALGEDTAAANTLAEREREHRAAINALTGVREKIEAHDAELPPRCVCPSGTPVGAVPPPCRASSAPGRPPRSA